MLSPAPHPPHSLSAPRRWLVVLGLVLGHGIGGPALAAVDGFAEQVAPLLEQHCLSCHSGPEPDGGFSLDNREQALSSGLIVSADGSSRLLEVVKPVDGQAQMPQDGPPLSAEQLRALTVWVAAGAPWPEGRALREPTNQNFDWWSLKPLRRPPVPAATDDWAQTPIDHFVWTRLNEQGLHPSPPADRRSLIRRVTYDLTGLPPSARQVEAFLHDEDPQAYERLVERLLGSPAYGERWARHWLDVVKYADTHGYDKDKLRPNAWPYRDYVIRSLNADKPYGRFLQEQIAGDVLYPGNPEGIVALGFLAAGPWDFIGHVEVAESKLDGRIARNLDRDDMLSNIMNTFCSLTIQCARCHNHKFDPISQQDYYGMQALLAAVDRADRPFHSDPALHRQRLELTRRLQELRASEQSFAREQEQLGGEALAAARQAIEELSQRAIESKPTAFGYHSQLAASPEQSKWVEVLLPEPAQLSRIVLHPCHDDFGGIGSGFGFPRRFRIEVHAACSSGAAPDGWQTVFDHTQTDFENPGLQALEVTMPASTGRVTRIRLTATRLAERQQDYMLALAELEAFDSEGRNLAAGGEVRALDSVEAPVRWQRANLTDSLWPGHSIERFTERWRTATAAHERLLDRLHTPQQRASARRLQAEIESLDEQLARLPAPEWTYAAATEFQSQGNFRATQGIPRDIRFLHRGNADQPRELAVPGWIALQPEQPHTLPPGTDEGQRRAELASWLTQSEHPLVWRSIVNRVWQYHFGRGIVDSPNDLGRMGQLPTHPALLDWLATEFRDGGQSIKSLNRMIVLSRTYQQASDENSDQSSLDGDNRYLWRGPRRQLSAEELRDSMLLASGALQTQRGGPGFYLFALEKTDHSPHYEYHLFDPADPASHRRSIYRFIVRSQPDPWMTTFDCADSSQSTPKRSETLTALQALSLMNSDFTLEMAQQLSGRLRRATENLKEQVALAGRLLLQRDWSPAERAALTRYGRHHGLDNLCRILFNLNEFVTLD